MSASGKGATMTSTSTYTVSGMTCEHCVKAVSEEVAAIEGVESVDVELESGQLTVRSEEPVPDEAVAAAVDEAGYSLVP